MDVEEAAGLVEAVLPPVVLGCRAGSLLAVACCDASRLCAVIVATGTCRRGRTIADDTVARDCRYGYCYVGCCHVAAVGCGCGSSHGHDSGHGSGCGSGHGHDSGFGSGHGSCFCGTGEQRMAVHRRHHRHCVSGCVIAMTESVGRADDGPGCWTV